MRQQRVVTNVAALCALLRSIPAGMLYRHNDAGDLPAKGRRHRFAVTNRSQHKTGKSYRSRTSKSSCPADCELIDICYASHGPISWHWRALLHWASKGAEQLDWRAVLQIADACSHLVAWTYTHWDWKRYEKTIRAAIARGFCVNVSTSDPAAAVEAFRAGLPVTLVAPPNQTKRLSLDGVPAFCCPALLQEDFTCDDCGGGSPLCSRPERSYIIMFPCHGGRARIVWERIKRFWKGWI